MKDATQIALLAIIVVLILDIVWFAVHNQLNYCVLW